MTHRPVPSRIPAPRSLAAALGLALVVALAAGCIVGDDGDSRDDSLAGLPDVDCAGIRAWAQNTTYVVGSQVTDTGDAFSALVAHTSFAPDWNPKRAASLWRAVGHCTGAGGPPPPQQPPPQGGDDDDESLPPPAEGCFPSGRPGPLFDPAGVPHVGNGAGGQFIGGQCLDASDCGSGCCALPCGICSGPGAQFQNGKLGCGFGD
jgi:hypothetical protein